MTVWSMSVIPYAVQPSLIPGWVRPGALVDLDFENGRYYPVNDVTQYVAVTRNTPGYVRNADGTLTQKGSNILRIGTGNGLMGEWFGVTNQLLWSQVFTVAGSGGTWALTGAPTVADNATTAPDGTNTASSWTRTTTASSLESQSTTQVAAATTYTFSIYAKLNTARYLALRFQTAAGVNVQAVADLSVGTFSTAPVVAGGFATPFGLITQLANGWWAVTLTATTDAAANLLWTFSFNSNGVVVDGVDSSSTSSGYVWGAQAELATFGGSYIPTTTTTQARAVDSINLINLAVPAGIGTSLWKISSFPNMSNGFDGIAVPQSNTSGSDQYANNGNVGGAYSVIWNYGAGSIAVSLAVDYFTFTSRTFGFSWDGTTGVTVAAAGTFTNSALTTTTPTAGFAKILENGFWQRYTSWNTRLADATLAAMTS